TQGVKVGLGVDGSASNDGAHLLNEARQALLLQRIKETNPSAMTARQALELATIGGAGVLGRDDIGALAPGMAADFAAWRLDAPGYSGALHDPVAALLFCQSQSVDTLVIHGRVAIQSGQFTALDLPILVEKHSALSSQLLSLK
ncbi:MAG: amidohydrolase family protein, partial [Armatimonadetes bacterium]|nr:amidohydrolase family protein [Anaerolineae bacterium]